MRYIGIVIIVAAILQFTQNAIAEINLEKSKQALDIANKHQPVFYIAACFRGIELTSPTTAKEDELEGQFIDWLVNNWPEAASFYRFDIQWKAETNRYVRTLLLARMCDKIPWFLEQFKTRLNKKAGRQIWGNIISSPQIDLPAWFDVAHENKWLDTTPKADN